MASFSSSLFHTQYKDGDDKTKTRTVGVELETVITNPDSPLSVDKCKEYMANISNRPIETIGRYEARNQATLENQLEKTEVSDVFAGVGADGSDIELVTHPDSINLYLDGGSDRLKRAMNYLKENATADKDKARNSGTHVHVGFLDTDQRDYIIDNTYWICMHFAQQLQKIAGRVTHWAQFMPYSSTITQQIELSDYDEQTKQGNLDIRRQAKPEFQEHIPSGYNKEIFLVEKSRTIEFRIFKATVDLEEVLAWAQLCHNIIELANGGKKLDYIEFEDLIQGQYIYDYVSKLTGPRELTALQRKEKIGSVIQLQYATTRENYIF